MTEPRAQPLGTHALGCVWFWAWALVGAAAALGAVSLGPILLLPVGLLAGFMVSRPGARGSAFGVLTGVGALALFVAFVNRDGPGTTCYTHGPVSGCDGHLDPRPWLVIGVVLFAGGLVGHARRKSAS